MKNENRSPAFQNISAADFFVLRSPLLPVEELLAWGDGLQARRLFESGADSDSIEAAWESDLRLLRGSLREIVERPEIVHALFIASPSLRTGIDHWKCDPSSKKGLQAERALVRYFARMSARPTPFGLFSGCSVGRVVVDSRAAATVLSLQPRQQYRPVSRLDFDYLFALTTALGRDPEVAMQLCYAPNSSLFRVADVWHYVESRLTGSGRTHHFVKVESDRFLDRVLDRARAEAAIPELVEAVLAIGGDDQISEEEATEYIQELIANGVLVSSLVPRVTEDPLDDIIAQAETLPSLKETAETLKSVRESMKVLDQKGVGAAPNEYRVIASTLEKLPAKFDPAKLYQVDMVKPVQSAMIAGPVIEELITGIEVMCRLGKTSEPEIVKAFRKAFLDRYDRASVPLLEALDEEVGIGFGEPASDSSPLLRGLHLGGAPRGAVGDGDDSGSTFSTSHAVLLRRLLDAARDGRAEVELDLADLPAAENVTSFLPHSFALNATLVAASEQAVQQGDFEIRVRGAVGPDGARYFGRFCHTDPELDRHVRDYLRQEEAQDSDTVYAEVVHLPEGRIGNVLCRPVLRQYELVYLGRSGAPQERQIPVSDLLVSVEGGQIVLFSPRIGRRIIPRLTNAHGFMNPTLSSVYRFLCYLQHQNGVALPVFGWGPLDKLDYLPRVRVGRVVLAPARWHLSRKEIDAIAKQKKARCFVAVQELRRNRSLPRWITFEEADNALPVDLNNPLSVDAFVHVLKRGSRATLREMHPSPEQLCVKGPEGRFYHELNVPFIRRSTEEKPKLSSHPASFAKVPREKRTLAPGSDWLYLKLYGGVVTLDEILTTAVSSFLNSFIASGVVTRWFFIRYADPRPHLRIRFNGPPDRMVRELIPAMSEIFHSLVASGRIREIQFATYEREIERYGGMEGTLAAEDIFFADSEAVLEILRQLDGDEGLDYRWRIILLGIDRILSDFGLGLEARCAAMERSRPGESSRGALGDKFRTIRRELDALFDPLSEISSTLGFARQAFERRSNRLAGAVSALRRLEDSGTLRIPVSDLIPSYIHMHVNRLVRSNANRHEATIYDFLFRIYDGQVMRGKRLATERQSVPG